MISVQVLLVLDCTSSMRPYIDSAKIKLLNILYDTEHKFQNCKIECGFIGYRDFKDNEKFIVNDFTKNFEKIENTIKKIKPIGGDDICEDVAGAYDIANSLSWSTKTVKCMFHITDAPNHGLKYHSNDVEDDYPNGHPSIELTEEVRELALKNVNLTLFKISWKTDIMYEIMKAIYEEENANCSIIKLDDTADSFYNEISSQLNETIANSVL